MFTGPHPTRLVELYRRYKVFTFGKYQGQNVAQVPSGYLEWLLGNFQARPWKLVAAIALVARGEAQLHRMPDGDIQCTTKSGMNENLGSLDDAEIATTVMGMAEDQKNPVQTGEVEEVHPANYATYQKVDYTDSKSMVEYARRAMNDATVDLLTNYWKSGPWETIVDKFGADLNSWVAEGKTREEAAREILREVLFLGKLEKTERIGVISLRHLGLRWTFEVRNLVLIELEG